MRVMEFLEEYALAFGSADFEALADLFDLPLCVVRPERSALVTDRGELLAHLEAIWSAYARAGLGPVRGTDVEEVGFEEGLGIVNVRWELYRRGCRTLITTVHSTYVLRRRDETLRIAGLVAHDESARRARIAGDESALRAPPARGGER